jgi:hypothetical protein
MPGNQTKDEWFLLPAVAGSDDALGTGVALVKPRDDTKKFYPDISYEGIIKIDEEQKFFAFMWVPHAVASYDQVISTTCGGRCSQTCKKPGCICDRSIGKCR